jgi:hypothetical protein
MNFRKDEEWSERTNSRNQEERLQKKVDQAKEKFTSLENE